MVRDREINGISGLRQLEKYAKDLREVYATEKQERKKLQETNLQIVKYADDLKKTISELKNLHDELRTAYMDTIQRLVRAAEFKDEDTADHIVRMSRYSAMIAEKLGFEKEDVQNILYAAPMHDVGKIGIPDKILMKPGKLTKKEFDKIKTHTSIGAKILADSHAEILKLAEAIALTHHERWDGKGYPNGLKDGEIPIVGRIVSIADVFDALTSKRPYKDPFTVDEACNIIKKERGEQFDPYLVDLFLDNMNEIIKVKTKVETSNHVHFSA
jgi:putative two-component system response regulator